jgi:hypothetical protein
VCVRACVCACVRARARARVCVCVGQANYSSRMHRVNGTCVFFCAFPATRLCNLSDLKALGLFIHDLNMYDSSRELVMAGWQHASRLETTYERVSISHRSIIK